jgi:hypothetical protein
VLTRWQAQTPQQRQANMRFAKAQEKKMGRPEGETVVKKREPQKSPISKIWISMFALDLVQKGYEVVGCGFRKEELNAVHGANNLL